MYMPYMPDGEVHAGTKASRQGSQANRSQVVECPAVLGGNCRPSADEGHAGEWELHQPSLLWCHLIGMHCLDNLHGVFALSFLTPPLPIASWTHEPPGSS